MIAGMVTTTFDVQKIREDFPVLARELNGLPLVYFDNAATTQKPQATIDAIVEYYKKYNANIHRGLHTLAEEATAAYEQTRDFVKKMVNAATREEIIFTGGTTDGINLVSNILSKGYLKAGDEIVISAMEHHSNIVPWQMACEQTGAVLKVIPIFDDGTLDMEAYLSMLSDRVKLVSVVYVSNALGTINPVKAIVQAAKKVGALTLIDGAQSTAHFDIDVQDIGCDFYAFSGHKLYGPTGIGVLYGRKALLESLPPYRGGGEMIKDVTFEKTTYNELPYKYEAGTPNIADTIALLRSLEYLQDLGKPNLHAYEQTLLDYGTALLQDIKGIRLVGTAPQKVSILSFVIDGVHPQDVGILLDNMGIAVRTGHHCTQPLMDRLGIPGTIRASLAFYNTKEELDHFAKSLRRAISMLL
jgi:cysteine desulfurase/selenocysteine lyase